MNEKKWADFQSVPRKDPPGRLPGGVAQPGSMLLAGRFPSIRLLNEAVTDLSAGGAQVTFVTVPLQGNKPFRTVMYLLWQNPNTGVYLAETRILEGTGQNPQTGHQAIPGNVLSSPKL